MCLMSQVRHVPVALGEILALNGGFFADGSERDRRGGGNDRWMMSPDVFGDDVSVGGSFVRRWGGTRGDERSFIPLSQ